MITFFQAVELPLKKVEASRVGCGTCPVSLACIVGQGGNGWKFDCCGATGYILDGLTVAIDCGKNNFEQNADAKTWKLCPLCSGGIMTVVERAKRDAPTDMNRYLLTEHAKVPLVQRLALWKQKREDAVVKIAEEQARKTT
jgi:hypothetical protein